MVGGKNTARIRAQRQSLDDQTNGLITVSRISRFELGKISWFENKQTLEDGFAKGFYYTRGNQVPLNFYVKDATRENVALYQKIAEWSDQVKAPNLLTPELVDMTFDGLLVVVGYSYDRKYDAKKTPVRFAAKFGVLDAWWIKQIKNLIYTIYVMHSNNIFHGALDKTASYVIRDEELCIVMPKEDGSWRQPNQKDSLKQKDMKGFGTFLNHHTGYCGIQNKDWNKFYTYFSYNSNNARNASMDMIGSHPVLMNEDERFNFLRGWLDSCFNRWKYPDSVITAFESWKKHKLQHFLPFFKYIQKGTVYATISETKVIQNGVEITYNEYSMFDFQRYLYNVLKHITKDSQPTRMPESTIMRDISTMFPGILGDLHFVCATFKGPERVGENFAEFVKKTFRIL